MGLSRTKPVQWLTGQVARLALFLLGLLPPVAAMAVSGRLFAFFGPRLRKSRQIRDNLSLIYPQWDQARIERCTTDIWRTFGENVAGIPHMESYVTGKNRDKLIIDWRFDPQTLAGKAYIACGVHLGHWEFGNAIFGRVGRPCVVTYKRVRGEGLNAMLLAYREANGAEFVEKASIPRQSVNALRDGKILHFTIDQRVEGGDEISFFGMPAKATFFPVRLALRFDCPLVPVECRREGGDTFRVIIHEPIHADASIADAEKRTQALAQTLYSRLEAVIAARPQEWFCLSRRWSLEEQEAIKKARGPGGGPS